MMYCTGGIRSVLDILNAKYWDVSLYEAIYLRNGPLALIFLNLKKNNYVYLRLK